MCDCVNGIVAAMATLSRHHSEFLLFFPFHIHLLFRYVDASVDAQMMSDDRFYYRQMECGGLTKVQTGVTEYILYVDVKGYSTPVV